MGSPEEERNRFEDGRCAGCGTDDVEHNSTACLYREMAAAWREEQI